MVSTYDERWRAADRLAPALAEQRSSSHVSMSDEAWHEAHPRKYVIERGE
jgi:hypothetical protein